MQAGQKCDSGFPLLQMKSNEILDPFACPLHPGDDEEEEDWACGLLTGWLAGWMDECWIDVADTQTGKAGQAGRRQAVVDGKANLKHKMEFTKITASNARTHTHTHRHISTLSNKKACSLLLLSLLSSSFVRTVCICAFEFSHKEC